MFRSSFIVFSHVAVLGMLFTPKRTFVGMNGRPARRFTPGRSFLWPRAATVALRIQFAQLETLQLAGRGARQGGADIDPARILPRPGALLDVHAQRLDEPFVGSK